MAVDPPEQGQGIGRVLMENLLDWLDRGRRARWRSWTPPPPARPSTCGWGLSTRGSTCRSSCRYGGPRGPAPEEALPVQWRDLPELEEFDEAVFGAPRGRMLRAYLAEFPGRAFLVRDPAGEVEGYLIAQEHAAGPLGWPGRRRPPGSCCAPGCPSRFEEGVGVLAPECNPDARTLLETERFPPGGCDPPHAPGRQRPPGDARPDLRAGQLHGRVGIREQPEEADHGRA